MHYGGQVPVETNDSYLIHTKEEDYDVVNEDEKEEEEDEEETQYMTSEESK